MNAHEMALSITIIIELLGVIFLALFAFIRLRANPRVFIIGLLVFLLVHLVNYSASQLPINTTSFGVQMIITAIQAIVLALGSYVGVKWFVNYSYRYRDFVTIGLGVAALKLIFAAKDNFGYLQTLLGNYTITEGGLTAEQYEQNAQLLLQKPIIDFYISLFEALLTVTVIILCAYLASSALNREEDAIVYLLIGAGAYIVYNAAYWALFRYAAPWLAFVVGLAAAVGSVIVLRSERE